jgi:5-methylcytosine-specific restriction endonuclease McrA
MGKRKTTTPKSKVRNALRQLWLRSRERATALKNANYCCERCGIKQSAAKGMEVKLQVHHKNGIDWDGLIELVIERLLPDPEELEATCKPCHDKEHGTTKKKKQFTIEQILEREA